MRARLSRSWGPGPGAVRGGVEFAVLTPDGKRVLWADEGPGLKVSDADTGDFAFSLPERGRRAPLLTPAGELALVTRLCRFQRWDLSGGRLLAETRLSREPWEFALAPDGGRIAGLIEGCRLALWSARDGKLLWEGPKNPRRFPSPASVAFSPDGGSILVAGDWTQEQGVFLHEAASGRRLWSWSGRGAAAVFGPDGATIAVCQVDPDAEGFPRGVVRLLSAADGRPLAEFPDFWVVGTGSAGKPVFGRLLPGPRLEWRDQAGAAAPAERVLLLSPFLEGLSLAADGSRLLAWGRGLRLWDLGAPAPRWERGPTAAAAAVAFAGGGAAVWCDETGRVNRAPLDGDAEIVAEAGAVHPVEPPRRAVDSIALSPDGSSAAALWPGGEASIWDLGRRLESNRLPAGVVGATAGARYLGGCLGLSADGRRAVAGRGKSVVVWDVERRAVAARLEGHQAWISFVALSPDGTLAVSSDRKGGVKAWDLAAMKEAPPFPKEAAFGPLFFSPDGRRLARISVRASHARLWDRASRSYVGEAGLGAACAFTADGKRLFGIWDKIRVLEAGSGKPAGEAAWMDGPIPEPLTCAAVSADGRRLLAGTRFGRIHLIELSDP